MEWPQWVVAGFLALQAVAYVVMNGKAREPINGPAGVMRTAVIALLLYAGGFWA